MGAGHSGFTRQISGFVQAADQSTFPDHAYDHAKVAFMDWMAVAISGMMEPVVEKLIHHVQTLGGHEQVSVLGHPVRCNVAQGALINGTMSHALDYDDTLPFFLGHPTVTLFPGLLALAEWKRISGIRLLTAYLVGIQIGSWIGRHAGGSHYAAGWHGTATIGRQASAAACANLLRLDDLKTAYALGIAGTQAAGLKRVFGTMCKPLHAGIASQTGVEASLLAARGFDSATDIYEGGQGFFSVLHGSPGEFEGEAFPGNLDVVENLIQKYHASCHFTHSPIDMILDIKAAHGLTARDVQKIEVFCSKIALETAGKIMPSTNLEAKFSIAYCVANALLRDDTGLHAFTREKVNAPEIRQLQEKIRVVVDDAHRDGSLKCSCRVTAKNGKTITKELDPLKYVPDLETKKSKIKNKFMSLCRQVLGDQGARSLCHAIETMDQAETMEEIINLVSEQN